MLLSALCSLVTEMSGVLPTAVPPVIIRLAEPEKRHDTCIEFTVRGYPHPKLRWFHEHKEILHNEYIRTEMDFYQDYLEGCLILQNPTHIHNGNYTLEASNPLGTATKTVHGHFMEDVGGEGEWTVSAWRLFLISTVQTILMGRGTSRLEQVFKQLNVLL